MLLLDLGNSSIKAQWWRQEDLQSSCRIRIQSNWRAQFEFYLSTIEATECYYAGVPGSDVQTDLGDCLTDYFGQASLHQLESLSRCRKVINAYPNPQGLGVDRWLALLGAARICPKDAIVVDAGSAITVDLIRASGEHLGGAIIPGFQTSLHRFKAILSMVDFDHADINAIEKPGVTSESCIHMNHDLKDTSYLNKLIDRWFTYLSADAVLIVSGGDASQVVKHPRHNRVLVPDLVFQGIRQQVEYC